MRKTLATVALTVSALAASAGLATAADPNYAEDHPLFNCTTMGDHTCGILAHEGVENAPAHCWSTDWFTNEYGYLVRAWYQGPREPHMPLDSASPCEETR